MKTKLVITSFIAGTMLLPVAGYAIDVHSNHTQPYPVLMQAMDPALTSQIKFKIGVKMPRASIDIDTAGGVVFLSGNASNQAEVSLAESIARGVKGVTSVQNTIQISPATSLTGLR